MSQSFDKVTNEKLPNGDVSQFMAAMNKELSSVKEKGVSEGLTLKDKAHFLAVARNLTDALEYYTKLWGGAVANQEESFDFPDLGVTVSPKAGGNATKISAEIFSELSMDEIKKAATVTEKALKEIGKGDLIERFKVITGSRANSVSYKSLV